MGFYTLGLDTSAQQGSIALLGYEDLLGTRVWEADGKHAERALVEIGLLLGDAGLTAANLDLLVVGVGPGSFTGVRIGLATMKGLALARSTPLVGVPSSEVVAIGAMEAMRPSLAPAAPVPGIPAQPTRVAVITNAFKGEVFGSLYHVRREGMERLLEPTHGSPDAVAELLRDQARGQDMLVVGNGAARYPEAFQDLGDRLPEHLDNPNAAWLVRAGLAKFERTKVNELHGLEPLYVRGADAELPAKPLRIEPSGTPE